MTLPVKNSALGIVVAVLLLLGIGLFVVKMNNPGFPRGKSTEPKVNVAAKLETPLQQKTYKIKKNMDVMGMQVLRVEHRQYPQEFVVVSGVGRDLAEGVFTGEISEEVLEPMVNQALALKMPDKKVSMRIGKIETLKQADVVVGDDVLPGRHVRVEFQLSTEKEPRVYEGTMVRESLSEQQDRVVVSFARVKGGGKEPVQFDQKLMNEFLKVL